MENSFQGMSAPPLEQPYPWFKCVHHVSEQVSTMSPVYTPS
jgi:hypothetical protein